MAYDLAYSKRWRYDRDRGIARTVDVGPARAHLEKLRGSRMSWRAISEVCGVTPSALCSIGLGRTQTINPDRAARILAVRPKAAFVRTNVDGFVPAVGARRRIRALLAIGWTHASICTAAGLPPTRSAVSLSQAGDFVALATHDRIAAAYDELTTAMQHLCYGSRRHSPISKRFRTCQDQVRFFALHRINPHHPPLVRVPVNSFEF